MNAAERSLTRRQAIGMGAGALAAASVGPALLRSLAVASAGSSRTTVQLLGTLAGQVAGRAAGADRRTGSALVVKVDGALYLVDAGFGALARLLAAGLEIKDVRHVMVTRHTIDHNADLGTALLLAWSSGRNASGANAERRLGASGPPGTGRYVRILRRQQALSIHDQAHALGQTPTFGVYAQPRDVIAAPGRPADVYADDLVRITADPTLRTGAPSPRVPDQHAGSGRRLHRYGGPRGRPRELRGGRGHAHPRGRAPGGGATGNPPHARGRCAHRGPRRCRATGAGRSPAGRRSVRRGLGRIGGRRLRRPHRRGKGPPHRLTRSPSTAGRERRGRMPLLSSLNRTSYLTLGLIRRGHRTGYEMKQVIDRVARFFWTVSYGQLYPELRKLRAAGLVSSREEMTGGRRRTVYELTPAGEAELLGWLDDNHELQFDLRAEGLLKLFVAADLGRERNLTIVRAFRAQLERQRDEIERTQPPREIGRRIREFGLELSGATVRWCEALEEAILAGELDDAPADQPAGKPRS